MNHDLFILFFDNDNFLIMLFIASFVSSNTFDTKLTIKGLIEDNLKSKEKINFFITDIFVKMANN